MYCDICSVELSTAQTCLDHKIYGLIYNVVSEWTIYKRKVVSIIPSPTTVYCIKIKKTLHSVMFNSASNRNEYQKCFLGVKVAGAQG
jgi:hypothetical protein